MQGEAILRENRERARRVNEVLGAVLRSPLGACKAGLKLSEDMRISLLSYCFNKEIC
jgi:hypothetical protein